MSLPWEGFKEAARWTASAVEAAQDKREQRLVRLVEHAGVLLAGTRELDRRAIALLAPLMYFEPSAWDAGRREDCVSGLITFVHDREIVPSLRTSLAALRRLAVDITDEDVQNPVDRILWRTRELFDISTPSEWVLTGEYYGDMRVEYAMASLARLIRGAESPSDSEQLRELARGLCLMRHRWREPGESERTGSALMQWADEMDASFGLLLAAVQQQVPSLATPAWVWHHEAT